MIHSKGPDTYIWQLLESSKLKHNKAFSSGNWKVLHAPNAKSNGKSAWRCISQPTSLLLLNYYLSLNWNILETDLSNILRISFPSQIPKLTAYSHTTAVIKTYVIFIIECNFIVHHSLQILFKLFSKKSGFYRQNLWPEVCCSFV